MRGQVNGKAVYAIYYDAGYSVDKVCALKAIYGGNARSMNNAADFWGSLLNPRGGLLYKVQCLQECGHRG